MTQSLIVYVGSPGEVRTPVGGSKAHNSCPLDVDHNNKNVRDYITTLKSIILMNLSIFHKG